MAARRKGGNLLVGGAVSLFALAIGRHLTAHEIGLAQLERSNLRAERTIRAKDKTIAKLMGRLQAAHFELDPTGNNPYAEFSDGEHTPYPSTLLQLCILIPFPKF